MSINITDFFDTGGIATIKHRCVTHLYGSNAIERWRSRKSAQSSQEMAELQPIVVNFAYAM